MRRTIKVNTVDKEISDIIKADEEECVTYAHMADPNGYRFRQYKKDPIPAWAVDVKPY